MSNVTYVTEWMNKYKYKYSHLPIRKQPKILTQYTLDRRSCVDKEIKHITLGKGYLLKMVPSADRWCI